MVCKLVRDGVAVGDANVVALGLGVGVDPEVWFGVEDGLELVEV